MTVKRPLRVVARVDERAVTTLHHDPGGLEDRTLVLTDEVHRQQLSRGVNLEADVLDRITLAFDVLDRPRDRCGHIDRCDAVPPIQAAVRRDGDLE